MRSHPCGRQAKKMSCEQLPRQLGHCVADLLRRLCLCADPAGPQSRGVGFQLPLLIVNHWTVVANQLHRSSGVEPSTGVTFPESTPSEITNALTSVST